MIAIAAVLTLSQIAVVAGSHSAEIDWQQIAKAASEYADLPSCENAAALIRTIPDRALRPTESIDSVIVDDLYGQLIELEAQMFRGDACAARVAFRLRRIADAAFGQELDAALGSLATTRPELFLRELERSGQDCEPVAGFDADYSEAEERAERTLRVSRLRARVSGVLEPTRKRCLQLLETTAQ